ncbi:MAG TPA: hypothetical protein VF619_01040 [Allosphingosinicella sp.]|jgi:hypothetical protein
MRVVTSIALALAIYAAAFVALRMGGVLGASAIFDWVLIAAAAALAVGLSRPESRARVVIIFATTAALAFLSGVLVSYAVLGDSF